MKVLYLQGYKWLLSQNQRVRNDFLGYRRYEALAKHIKPFLKNIKVKGRQYLYYMLFEHSFHKFNRNSAFISSFQKSSSKIYFYPFPRNNRIAILFKKWLREIKRYLLEGTVMKSTVSFKSLIYYIYIKLF